MTISTPTIFISAGEASGERYGAMLIQAIRTRVPGAQFFGLGGSAMEAAGCDRVVRAEDIAVLGITEVVRHMPRIYGEYRRLVKSIQKRRPTAAVLIDFPDVNFRLARELSNLGIPVIYFVSPQLWAWKKHRIRWVRQRVTKMLVIFPFEEAYYRERGVDAQYVGHPLADISSSIVSRQSFANEYGLDASKNWIGLLPGSREKELHLNLPAMASVAHLLKGSYEYLLPVAATLQPDRVRSLVSKCRLTQRGNDVPIHVVEDARAVLSHSRASVVASGTATVEAALIGNPFIAVYRLSPLSHAVASRLVQLPHVAMVNLIAGKRVVPELIQNDFTPEQVARNLLPLLADSPARLEMQRALAEVRNALHVNSGDTLTAVDRVADWVVRFVNGSPAEAAAATASL